MRFHLEEQEEQENLLRGIILADIIAYRMRGLKENGSYSRESPSFRSALYTIYSKLDIEDLRTIHELKVLYYERTTERRKN
jgi:hypothetical protein